MSESPWGPGHPTGPVVEWVRCPAFLNVPHYRACLLRDLHTEAHKFDRARDYHPNEQSRALPRTRDACRLSNPVHFPEHYAGHHARHCMQGVLTVHDDEYNGETCTDQGTGTVHIVRNDVGSV